MKTSEIVRESTLYTSEIVPSVSSENEDDGEVIAWADANPVAWKIVMGTKSAVYGKNSSTYYGCDHGPLPHQVIARLVHFRRDVLVGRTDPPASSEPYAIANGNFWAWRAKFTLEHYNNKGFRGGMFQQFDGHYDRACTHLDYTPATLDEVVDQFIAWCDRSLYRYDTVAIKVDSKVVRNLTGVAHV